MYTMNISHKEYSVIKDSSIKKRNPKKSLGRSQDRSCRASYLYTRALGGI